MTKKSEIRIGTAGNPANFYKTKYKKEIMNCPLWLAEIGLKAYEFQATHGVKTPEHRAKLLRDNAKKANVALSIHAPFFVVLTSLDSEIVSRSVQRMVKAIKLAELEEATKVIFHPGYYHDDPKKALHQCEEGLMKIIKQTEQSKVIICPETGGKKSALGSMDDLIHFDKLHKRINLCIDFGHHHARTGGSLKSAKDFIKLLEYVEKEIPGRIQNLHCHFSPLIYTEKGEKNHVSGYEKGMGPDYKHLCEAVVDLSLTPTIICETQDTQDIMALKIKKEIEKLMK